MKTTILYSQLVSADNHTKESPYPGERPKERIRYASLEPYKLVYTKDKSIDDVTRELIAKIKTLPVGTHFSQGSLVKCHDRFIANDLGKVIKCLSEYCDYMQWVTSRLGKRVYVRLDKHTENILDFYVELKLDA